MGTPNSALRELVLGLLAGEEIPAHDLEDTGLDIQFLELVCRKIKPALPYVRGFKRLGDWDRNSELPHDLMLGRVALLTGAGTIGQLLISRTGEWVVIRGNGRLTPGGEFSYRDDQLRQLITDIREWNPNITSPNWPHSGGWVCPAVQIAYCLLGMLADTANSLEGDTAKMKAAHNVVHQMLRPIKF